MTVYAPPGVSIVEDWDDPQLLHWREGVWLQAEHMDDLQPPARIRRLTSLHDVVALVPAEVPAEALGDTDVHAWIVAATEGHADAIERLSLLQEAQPAEGVRALTESLRRVAREHRQQAAEGARTLSGVDLSAHDVAKVVEQQPDSVVAVVERLLSTEERLPALAEAVGALNARYGSEPVQDAVLSLLFAKQHSHSWQVTKPVREAHRTTRRTVRRMRRLLREISSEHGESSHRARKASEQPVLR